MVELVGKSDGRYKPPRECRRRGRTALLRTKVTEEKPVRLSKVLSPRDIKGEGSSNIEHVKHALNIGSRRRKQGWQNQRLIDMEVQDYFREKRNVQVEHNLVPEELKEWLIRAKRC